MNKWFLVQIKRTSGTYEKGVVVKETEDAAKQSFFAYLGAYGFGHDANTDYVQVCILTDDGRIVKSEIDDRRTEEA